MLYTIDEIRTRAMPIAIRYSVDAISLLAPMRGEKQMKKATWIF